MNKFHNIALGLLLLLGVLVAKVYGAASQTPGPARPGDLANTPTAQREAKIPWPGAPPQDKGLPYSETGPEYGRAAINDYIAVFSGSRYAYALGYKIRLDDGHLLDGDAITRDGKIYVPEAFAGVLALKTIKPDPAPLYLADRWVYTLNRPTTKIPSGVGTLDIDGKTYVDLAALAGKMGFNVWQNSRGLLLLGKGNVTIDDKNQTLMDDIVMLFDTPEKLMDPGLVAQYIPRLAMQGQWSDRVNFTPEQQKLLDGLETTWPGVPLSAYDLTGFNTAMLGSKVPAPGVYPRLLFSPEDVPAIYARMKSQKVGQKTLAEWDYLLKTTWWDPKTDDGKVFQKLVAGQIDQLQFIDPQPGRIDPLLYIFKGQTPGIYNAYVNYTTNSLATMALYCLLTGDDEHGRQAAAAIVNYYRKIEPLLDKISAMSDSEFGTNSYMAKFSETGFRGMRLVISHMDLPFLLDFAGKWMTTEQKAFMCRIIAKATYGRRDDMQAAPARLRDGVNTTWYLTDFIAASAIEGLEGCDPEVLQMGRDTVRDFLDWGIDEHGMVFEGNGTNLFGMQFEILSMIIMARRGDNLWGHPHFRKMLDAQVESMSPDGWAVLSSGRFGAGPFSFQAADEIKAFYPGSRAADWILSHTQYEFDPVSAFDEKAFQNAINAHASRIRLPGLTYPGSAFSGVYDTDWQDVSRADVQVPKTYNNPVYGFLSAYSDDTSDAAWLALHVRSNQYLGSGQFHSDVGMFYFSSGGVNWITEANFTTESSGKYHNLVLIANRAEPDDIPARGDYLGASTSDQAAFGTVDQKNSYSYEWRNQVELWEDSDPTLPATASTEKWELETDPVAIAAYKGTQDYKSRAWYASYTITNWIPVVRRPFNPVQYAFRTAGLVRGPHPYGLVVDDIKKDDQPRLYQWTAIMGANITQAKFTDQSPNEVYLVRSTDLDGTTPKPGVPLLMVSALSEGDAKPVARVDAMKDGPINRYDEHDRYNRVTVDLRAPDARYRVFLIPFKMGDPRPQVTYDPKTDQATLHWPDQEDVVKFTSNPDNRTRFTMERSGGEIVSVK